MEASLDILILTAGFGTGHLSASIGIKQQIQKINPNINIEIVDMFHLLIPRLSRIMYKAYTLLVRTSPNLYNYFHYKDNKNPEFSSRKFYTRNTLKKLKHYIVDINPKLIISTFPVTSQYISRIKDDFGVTVPMATCITDVVNGWEWITPNCDRYFVATKDVKENMINKGIAKDKVIVTGIPLREEFLENPKVNPEPLLPEQNTILMIMGGGMGLIPDDDSFYQWINSFDKLTTIVLTGNNTNLFRAISKLNLENIIPFKYTDEIASLMSQSDLLITKAGGITLFEAIACDLPIIAYRPELGQEIENSKFICEKLIGDIAYNIDELQYIIKDLSINKSKITRYKTNMAKLKYDIDMKTLAEESMKLLYNS